MPAPIFERGLDMVKQAQTAAVRQQFGKYRTPSELNQTARNETTQRINEALNQTRNTAHDRSDHR